ncbi:MAG TPA: CPBP family glutamic-type intramembrane protease, partial [Polyangia bacterium]|nr:CPBP family glutamic-type intramembrane protease [Polyangia bacterium]
TAYLFLLLGGLTNVVFQSSPDEMARVLCVYALAIAALWRAGLDQVQACLDPEARAGKGPRLSDAAILLVLVALLPRGLIRGGASAQVPLVTLAAARFGVLMLLGLAAGTLLLRGVRRPGAPAKARPLLGALGVGVGLGVAARLIGTTGVAFSAPGRGSPATAMVPVVLLAITEELIFRGVVQGALEIDPASPLPARSRPWTAAALALALAWLAALPTLPRAGVTAGAAPWGVLLVGWAPALARASTGRWLAACVARVVLVATF